MPPGGSGRLYRWQVLCLLLSLSCGWGFVTGQLRYSVPEESEPGTVVGNVARDLGLDAAAISKRNLALAHDPSRRYFTLNLASGALLVNEKIDRELVCGPSTKCLLSEEVTVAGPLELFRLEVEILDVNDNAPRFLSVNQVVRITELVATPGTTFPLEGAQDPDVGRNTVSAYTLSPNPFFSLALKRRGDGTLSPELLLEKVLDREEQEQFQLILTAFDGGHPAKSGSAQITVNVLDLNDNAPTFERSVYNVSVLENSPVNSILIKLNATDVDAGKNGNIEYSFEEHTLKSLHDLFSLDPHTGEVRVQSPIYYEEANFYELSIQAKDLGVPVMVGRCVVYVHVEDVNDNAPEILLKSHGHSVPENTPIGTAVGFFRIRDRDSGHNGKVKLELFPSRPFTFKSFGNHYSLMTDDVLDRETTAQYTITLVATDMGSPPLQTQAVIYINVSDTNDNPPRFSQPVYNTYIKENNNPGALLCTVSASDPDVGENSLLTFSIGEDPIGGSPASSFVYINSLTGNIYAQRSFDFESIQVLHIPVKVEDAGLPKLSSNISLYVFILDQNDNSPNVLYPAATNEPHVLQKIPKHVPKGYLISKVTAVDADSGHNAWISYSLLKPTNTSLFRVSAHTGEIRSVRDLEAISESQQTLLVLVQDNGHPSLSTTVTILLSFDDRVHEERPKSRDFYVDNGKQSETARYLIIALVAITLVSLVTFIILFIKCRRNSSRLLCCFTSPMPRTYSEPLKPALQLHSDGTMKYVEVSLEPPEPQDLSYQISVSPESERKDFNFMKPLNFPQLKELMNEAEGSISDADEEEEPEKQAQPFQQSQPFQQAPTNTDWRFSAAQRPGTSGSQNSEEAGGWPNNQFETERLQAMILASANEGADGSSTLGGAGTMGLSARYGPQFTLQHVPDYRQNVYIPGSTATLANAAAKRDGKAAASGANKKKSGKKEKK